MPQKKLNMAWCGSPSKNCPVTVTYSLINMQTLVAVSYGVRVCMGSQINLWALGPAPLDWGYGWPNINTPLPLPCYVAEFGSSRSKGRYGDLRENRPLASTAKGHQNRQGSIVYIWFLLVIIVIMGLSRAVSKTTGDFGKSHFFIRCIYQSC